MPLTRTVAPLAWSIALPPRLGDGGLHGLEYRVPRLVDRVGSPLTLSAFARLLATVFKRTDWALRPGAHDVEDLEGRHVVYRPLRPVMAVMRLWKRELTER